MVVTYAKLWPRFACELTVEEDVDKLFGFPRVLFCDPVLERGGTTSLGQRIRSVDAAVRECDLLVLRGLKKEDFSAARSEIDLVQRLTGAVRCYLLLGGPPTPYIEPFFGTKGRINDNLLAALRDLEVRAIIQRTGARFQDSGFHYLLPSGEHATTFLRVADALQDPTEVSRLADWLAARLDGECVLVGDNGSLLPLLLATKDRARTFRKGECHIRTLAAYPAGAEEIEPLFDDVATRYPTIPIVFVISISASGTLARRLKALAPSTARVVVICDAETQSTHETLHRCEIGRYPADADGRCPGCASKHLVGIDPRTYERIPNLRFETRSVNRELAQRDAPFWVAANRVNAVKLHYNLPVGEIEARHHGVYVDVASMLRDPWFRGLVIQKLRTLLPPALLLVPNHAAIDPVIDAVLEAFPKTPTLKVQRGKLPPKALQRIRALSGGQTILIADDALVQGTTIRGLRYAVYQATQSMSSAPTLQAFVCLARPDTEATLRNAINPYRDQSGSHFHYAYQLFLPTSGEDHCTWCKERRLLSQLVPRLEPAHRQTAITRRDLLDTGDLTDKFLWDTEELSGSEVTKDSFFGDLAPRAAFAAATASTQQVRQELSRDHGAGKAAVMNLPAALANYFDTVLLAAILRTLEIRELYYLGLDHEVRTAVARFPAASAYPGLVAELGWAAINKKLPGDLVGGNLGQVPQTRDIQLLRAILRWQREASS